MSHPPVILGHSTEIVWSSPDADTEDSSPRPVSAPRPALRSEVLSPVVLFPHTSDVEVEGYEISAFARYNDEDALRRTPGPGHGPFDHSPPSQVRPKVYSPQGIGEGYNTWFGTNILSGIVNTGSIVESPVKFDSVAPVPVPVCSDGVLPPKRSESPPRQSANRKLLRATFSERESGEEARFVEKVIEDFSFSQEQLVVKERVQDRELALIDLRDCLQRPDFGEGGSSTTESQGFEKDREPSDSTDRPMSPTTKAACKEFIREFRKLERVSTAAAQQYAVGALQWMPSTAHWRVHLQLADLAKRLNLEELASREYEQACTLEPTASKGWLEWSKMQDECGSTETALQTILQGILAKSEAYNSKFDAVPAETSSTRFDEVLILRALRLYEKQYRLEDARRLIYSVCSDQTSIEKIWRVLFEGAQIEYRAGETARARTLYNFLMDHVPWYGPIYSEALRLEETGHHFTSCIGIIKRGLHELHRYGPLWFGLMRAVEQFDVENEKTAWGMAGCQPRLDNVKLFLELAVKHISRELVWKLHFEMGQIVERAVHYAGDGKFWLDNANSCTYTNGCLCSTQHEEPSGSISNIKHSLLGPARKAYLDSLLSCPSNLRWKVLLAGARMEISAGQYATSRELLAEAMAIVPAKSKSYVYLECARLEEFLDNFLLAQEILFVASLELPGEWKISLEIATQHARRGNFASSLKTLVNAVEHHSNSGRLWALIIQLFSSAWKENSTATLLTMSSLFEKTTFFPIYCNYMSPIDDSNEILNREDNNRCSHEREIMTDTEKSCESIHSDLPSKSKEFLVVGSRSRSIVESLSQMRSIRKLVTRLALEEVPKSGECWCEAARTAMNPFDYKTEFDLSSAHRCLAYAILFTPQYGDSFIERVRLELLCQVILPDIVRVLGIDLSLFYSNMFECDIPEAAKDTFDYVEDFFVPLESTEVGDVGLSVVESTNASKVSDSERQHRRTRIENFYQMTTPSGYCAADFKRVLLKKLYRSCVNADPNYGSLWFYCREKSLDDASEILGVALDTMIHEICATQDIYCRGIAHFVYKSIRKFCHGVFGANSRTGFSSRRLSELSKIVDDFEIVLRKNNPCNPPPEETSDSRDFPRHNISLGAEEELCAELFDGIYFPIDFSSALIELNRSTYHCDRLSNEARRTQIFCSDQVMP